MGSRHWERVLGSDHPREGLYYWWNRFGELEGHTLIIFKALYGLKSSGARWHERLVDVLREHGFSQSKADSDVWMRQSGNVYEYIAVYTDDLAIASPDPKAIIDALMERSDFKLKGWTTPIPPRMRQHPR